MVMVHYFSRIEKLKIITYLRNAPKINLGFPESREKKSPTTFGLLPSNFVTVFIVRRSSFIVLPPCSSFFEAVLITCCESPINSAMER